MLRRFFDSWWFQVLLGLAALFIISLIMFDAVAIGVLGRSLFFSYPN